MNPFQLCQCGAAPGYPHAVHCPRPLFGSLADDDPRLRQWEAERQALIERLADGARELPALDPLSDGP